MFTTRYLDYAESDLKDTIPTEALENQSFLFDAS